MKRFLLTLIVFAKLLPGAFAGDRSRESILFELTDKSTYTEGCYPPCLCPISVETPVKGTFELRLLEPGPLFTTYEVSNLFWTVTSPSGSTLEIFGCGTYDVGGEFAVSQRLQLELRIEREVLHFDSGIQSGGGLFPGDMDITVSMNNMECFDRVFEIHAASPAAPDTFEFLCGVADDTVLLSWTVESPEPPIARFEIWRDAEVVATLDPGTREYRERAPPGKHVYAGFAITAAVAAQDVPGGNLFMGSCCVEVSATEAFARGDCNGDGQFRGQVTDAVFLLNSNFTSGPEPPCLAACDVNGDGSVTGEVSDAVYMLNFNFLGGPPPAAPFPGCGPGPLPGDESLGCKTPPGSCL